MKNYIGIDYANLYSKDKSVFTVFQEDNGVIKFIECGEVKDLDLNKYENYTIVGEPKDIERFKADTLKG